MTSTLQPVSVRILADDLTGACDAAVAFACAGLPTEVETSWAVEGLSQAAVVAYNTESRNLTPRDSASRMMQAADRFAANSIHHLFKKIDSVFRGNTLVEIEATLSVFPHDVAILAPAFPALGRTLVNGELHYRDITGDHQLSVLAELERIGLVPVLVPMPAGISANHKLLICDSATQEDLTAIVRSALQLSPTVRLLWIGSGGLAHALAANLDTQASSQTMAITGHKVLFLIGSDHPVTLKQIQHLAHFEPDAIVLPITRDMSLGNLRDIVAPHLDESISCLFATGGDTALAVCRALDINRFEIYSEFARGVPQARVLGGPLDGVAFILKSGGFGDENLLSCIARTFTHQETRPTR